MESRDPGGCGEILGQAILTSGSSRESRGQDHSGGEAMGRASSYGGLRGPCRGENQIKTEALGKAISGPSPGRWMGLEQRPSFVCVCVCMCVCVCVCVLVAQSCPTLCDPSDCNLPGSSISWNTPGKNTRVGCHSLLQGIFPTQGSNPGIRY